MIVEATWRQTFALQPAALLLYLACERTTPLIYFCQFASYLRVNWRE